jgi:hypothetical protein
MSKWSLAIALSVAAAAQAAPPPRVEIAYQVLHNGGPLAEVKHVLEHDGAAYRLSETWNGNGLLALLGEVRRASRGRITAEGLRPLEYEDQRPRRPIAHARFGWEARTLTQEFRDGPRVRAAAAARPGPAELPVRAGLRRLPARIRSSTTSPTARAWRTTSSTSPAANASAFPQASSTRCAW